MAGKLKDVLIAPSKYNEIKFGTFVDNLCGTKEDSAINIIDKYKADLVNGKVPAEQLPSYVDDVIEATNMDTLPVPGEAGKIYVTLNDNLTYRWSGSAYVLIAQKPLSAGTNIEITPDGFINATGGVEADDVMEIIEENSEQTTTLDVEEVTEIAIGTSETFDSTSDEQIPTSKAVSDLMASAGGGSKLYKHQITFGQYSSRLNIIIDRADVFDVASLKEYLNTKGYIGDTKGLFVDGYPSTLTESNGTKYLMYANKIYINTGNGNINSNGIKVSIIMSDTVPNITTENYTITVSTLTDRVFEL